MRTSPAEAVAKHRKKSKTPAEDFTPAMLLYWDYLNTGECSDVDADIAFEIYSDDTQREILEALILGNCPDSDIFEAFKIPLKAIRYYKELFFDVTWFRTHLEKISYIEQYDDPLGRELKVRALNIGYEYILFTYANIVPRTNAQKALIQKMFMSSAYKAMNMNYASMNSATMRQAVEHGKLMLKAYETLEKINTESTNESYSLSKIIPTTESTYTNNETLDGELV